MTFQKTHRKIHIANIPFYSNHSDPLHLSDADGCESNINYKSSGGRGGSARRTFPHALELTSFGHCAHEAERLKPQRWEEPAEVHRRIASFEGVVRPATGD